MPLLLLIDPWLFGYSLEDFTTGLTPVESLCWMTRRVWFFGVLYACLVSGLWFFRSTWFDSFVRAFVVGKTCFTPCWVLDVRLVSGSRTRSMAVVDGDAECLYWHDTPFTLSVRPSSVGPSVSMSVTVVLLPL